MATYVTVDDIWQPCSERDAVGCLPYSYFPFLLANGKLISLCGFVSTLADESQPIWISSAYPGTLDWFKDGSGPTWGWQILMTHLLGNPSKYFIPEKREAQKRTALLSLLLLCLVTCHMEIQYWIMINVLHPRGDTSLPYWEWRNVLSGVYALDTGKSPV